MMKALQEVEGWGEAYMAKEDRRLPQQLSSSSGANHTLSQSLLTKFANPGLIPIQTNTGGLGMLPMALTWMQHHNTLCRHSEALHSPTAT